MFEKSKGRYLTRGVDAEIPIALQVMMWQAVDQMPEPKDYLQVFRLSEKNGLQIVHHTSEQPQFEMTYIASGFLSSIFVNFFNKSAHIYY